MIALSVFLATRLLLLVPLSAAVWSSCFAPSEPLPAPVLDPSSPELVSLFSGLDSIIQDALKAAPAPWNTTITSFAIEVTSANVTLWQNYHTAPVLGNYTDGGPTDVAGETAFRIASISKVFTVLAVLLQQQAGNLSLKDPVTEYLPELLENEIEDCIQWEHISLESLASQLSGVPREYGQEDLGDQIVAKLADIRDQQKAGFPPLLASDYPTCGMNHETSKTCSREDVIQGSKKKPPVFGPNYRSTYSNIAFILLGFVLEQVTGRSYQDLLSSSILDPLGMHHTTVKRPNSSMGVIPVTYNDWAYVAGAYDPTGGLYSTSSDLSIFLRAILRSELLDQSTTNAWFKPHSWSSSLNAAYGMPWEMYRTTELLSNSDRGMTIITKGGHLYGYSSLIILLPEYDLGITLLIAGESRALSWLQNKVLTATANTIEEIARGQVKEKYAGTYSSSKINSSVSLDLDGSSGLVINEWVSNGTDFLHEYISFQSNPHEPTHGEAQLVPAGIRRSNGGEVWRATFVPNNREPKSVIDACMINDVDSLMYGGRSLHEFVFILDGSGHASSVEIPALRVTLHKTGDGQLAHQSFNSRALSLAQKYLGL